MNECCSNTALPIYSHHRYLVREDYIIRKLSFSEMHRMQNVVETARFIKQMKIQIKDMSDQIRRTDIYNYPKN